MSLEQFKCLKLDSDKYQILELHQRLGERRCKSGVHVFYMHQSHFREASSTNIRRELFKSDFSTIIPDLPGIDVVTQWAQGEQKTVDPNLYVITTKKGCTDFVNVVGRFGGAIRKNLIEGGYQDSPLILLAAPIAFDCFNTVDESLFTALSNAHEYIVWFDGRLADTTEESPPSDMGWCGNGLASWLFQQYRAKAVTNESNIVPSGFHDALVSAMDDLRRYETLISNSETSVHQYNRNDDYLFCLADYLPAYRQGDELIKVSQRWPDEPEGPKEWPGIFGLSLHERYLLLDGWLTLWPEANGSGKLLVQPSSLAMLHWVSQKLLYPHSNTAEELMKHYFDWKLITSNPQPRHSRGWFSSYHYSLGWFSSFSKVTSKKQA